MPRIELTDTSMDVFVKMSGGNPGALQALMEMHMKGSGIDPQAMMGGFGAILLLDTYEIYDSAIYVLWNDECGRDVRRLLLLLRASQMGYLSDRRVKNMAGDQTRKVSMSEDDWAGLEEWVAEALPSFAKAA